MCRFKPSDSSYRGRGGAKPANRGFRSGGKPKKPYKAYGMDVFDEYLSDQSNLCLGTCRDSRKDLIYQEFTVDGKGKPQILNFMVDCGANSSLMSTQTYEKHFSHLPLQPASQRPFAVDGRPVKDLVGIVEVSVSFGTLTHRDKFHVCASRTKDLLGNNFLRPLKVKIDCEHLSVIASLSSPDDLLLKFPNLVKDDMGKFQGQPHRIRVTDDAQPVAVTLRSVPLALKDKVIDEIKLLDKLGVWKPVEFSEWAHPLVSVLKKDGGVRITTDLTRLNLHVVPERHPLPKIRDLLINMAGSTVFSKLDLKKGYLQIPLHEESQPLTTTITPLGLRQYLRMPMGLKDSASAFQRRVQQTLQGLQGVEVYIDDIIVHGKTQEQHNLNLAAVFRKLQETGFRLQPKKLMLSQKELPAFGYILSKDGIRPDPSNVHPILNAAAPSNAKELQSFLGAINYFQDFLQDVASIAEPLRALTRKETSFQWTHVEDLAFRTLKAMLAEKTQLQIFDPDAETFVTTDASDAGMGALLSQRQSPNDPEYPISFFNKTLDSSERNYSASEREALACMSAVEHWEHLLLARPFTLRTDHQALESVLLGKGKGKRQISKFIRWKERLDAFNFKVQHLPGHANKVADYLSRIQLKADSLGVTDGFNQVSATLGEITTKSSADEEIQNLLVILKSQSWEESNLPESTARSYKDVFKDLHEKDGLLYKGQCIVPPVEMRKKIILDAHKGHPGTSRTEAAIRAHFWWPILGRSVKRAIENCVECQLSSKSKGAAPQPETTIPRPTTPGAQWGLDIAGPFFNGRYLVSLVDYASRFPEVKDTKNIDSSTIIKWMDKVWSRCGNPVAIVTDNGPQFTSKEFSDYLKSRDIHHYTTPVYHPQENGLVEVFNRTLKHGIQAFGSKPWNDAMRQLLKTYRLTPGLDGRSPAEIFFSRKVRPDWAPNTTKPSRRTHIPKKASGNDLGTQFKPWTSWSLFQVGDKLLAKTPWTPKGLSPWKGPFTVKQVLGSFTFLLSDGQVWNASKLKRYRVDLFPDEFLDDPIQPQPPIQRPVQGPAPQPLRRSTRIKHRPQRYPEPERPRAGRGMMV